MLETLTRPETLAARRSPVRRRRPAGRAGGLAYRHRSTAADARDSAARSAAVERRIGSQEPRTGPQEPAGGPGPDGVPRGPRSPQQPCPVDAYLSLLRRHLDGSDDTLDILDKIEAGFTALEATVNDLLQFTSNRDPSWQTFHLDSLVEEVCDALAPQFVAQGIRADLDIPVATLRHRRSRHASPRHLEPDPQRSGRHAAGR